ncbi:MAG: hypothetical protein HKO57_15555 [Akkermansiaceae bacterium]|nr:hypothetical protein [Akkermansiaceae bacterium]
MATPASQNYEKIILAIAVIAALGFGAVVFLQAGKLDEQFTRQAPRKQDAPPLPGEKKIAEAVASLGTDKEWKQAKVAGGRSVDLFTGIAWFVKKGESAPVDLLAPDEAPVHPPITNLWWIENDLDPGYADAPARDPDKDGFSNLEEFTAETDPKDFSSHPPLGSKLRLANLESLGFLLTFSSEIGDNKYQFRYEDTKKGQNKMKTYIGRGDTFFLTAPALQRFRVKDVVEEKVTNERTNLTTDRKFAFVEDLKPNKDGKVYKIPKGMRTAERPQYIQRDYTAVLELAAAGQSGETFRVEENTRFALPFDEAAAEKPYLFKEVRNGDTVIIEWEEDGETKTLELRKPAS